MAAALPQLPGAFAAALDGSGRRRRSRHPSSMLLLVGIFVGAGLVRMVFVRVNPRCAGACSPQTRRPSASACASCDAPGPVLGTVLVFATASSASSPARAAAARRDVQGASVATFLFRLIHYVCQLGAGAAGTGPAVDAIGDGGSVWLRRLVIFAGIFLFGWAGGDQHAHARRRAPSTSWSAISSVSACSWRAGHHLAAGRGSPRRRRDRESLFAAVGWTVYAAAVLLLWLSGANRLMWLILVIGVLPLAIRVVNASSTFCCGRRGRSPRDRARPADEAGGRGRGAGPRGWSSGRRPGRSVAAAEIDARRTGAPDRRRGDLLFWAWDIDARAIASGTSAMGRSRAPCSTSRHVSFRLRLARGADRHRHLHPRGPQRDGVRTRRGARRARLRTLLPISST
jgi:hypothetical protein